MNDFIGRLIEMCVPVEIKGQDRRKAKFQNNLQNIKELLGV